MENLTSSNLESLRAAFVSKKARPISELPECHKGSEPDAKALILSNGSECKEAERDPIASKYVREYMDGKDFREVEFCWCLWLKDSTPEERENSKFLKARVEASKVERSDEEAPQSPWLFGSMRQPDYDYLALPAMFSEKSSYFPAAFLNKDVIAGSTLYAVSDPDCFAFSVIETSMFTAWQDLAGGRLETLRIFSSSLVWNTFPLRALTKDQKALIIEGGKKVLDARAGHPGSSLADLYNPDSMPKDLKKAHEELDKVMDSIFSDKPFESEEERQKALLESYRKMTGEKEGE